MGTTSGDHVVDAVASGSLTVATIWSWLGTMAMAVVLAITAGAEGFRYSGVLPAPERAALVKIE